MSLDQFQYEILKEHIAQLSYASQAWIHTQSKKAVDWVERWTEKPIWKYTCNNIILYKTTMKKLW